MASIANEEILRAARFGDYETLRVAARLLGTSLLEVMDQDGYTALHIAAAEGIVDLVKLLLAVPNVVCVGGKDFTTEPSVVSSTVTSSAATDGRPTTHTTEISNDLNNIRITEEVCNAANGVSSTNVSIRPVSSQGSTRSSESALPYCGGGNSKNALCPSCLASTDISIVSGESCLKCGKLIENRNATPKPSLWASIASRRGHTALHFAAMKGQEEIVRLLLKSGFNVNAVSKQNATPIHIAGVKGHTKVVKILLDAGADPDIRVKTGRNLREAAEALELTEVTKILKNN